MEKQQTLLNHVSHSGVILEPSKAGQQPLQQTGNVSIQQQATSQVATEKKGNLSKVLKGIAAGKLFDVLSKVARITGKI